MEQGHMNLGVNLNNANPPFFSSIDYLPLIASRYQQHQLPVTDSTAVTEIY